MTLAADARAFLVVTPQHDKLFALVFTVFPFVVQAEALSNLSEIANSKYIMRIMYSNRVSTCSKYHSLRMVQTMRNSGLHFSRPLYHLVWIACFAPRFWVLLGLKTHQVNNVNGIYQLFLNYFNVTISNLATAS